MRLRTAGRPLDRIDPDDLAGLDELHALGRAGTLADRAALADQVTVIEGDGRALPFAGAGFDVAWAQAVWQSIDDKVSLTREIHRVLRPGGRLALLEVAGDDQELRHPAPWADGPAQSFVVPGDELALLLTGAGFAIEAWWCAGGDAQAAIAAATADTGRMAAGLPEVGLELLMPDYPARMAGLASNVEAGRISLLLAVVRKEGTPAIAADQQSAGGRR